MPLVVKLQFIDTELYGRGLFITINGRQALHEGPRLVGRCVYCKGRCAGATPNCDRRVYDDSHPRDDRPPRR